MSVQVTIQPWSESSDAEEGFIANWFAREGAAVREGQVLGEVMVEKATLEVVAPQAGTVRRVLIQRSDVVKPGQVVAEIATEAEAEGASAGAALSAAAPTAPVQAAAASGTDSTAFVPASPAAKRLARELGVDLSKVAPAHGERITEEDVRRVADAGVPASPTPSETVGTAPTGERLGGMRRAVAERMMRSLQQSAQLTLTTEASADALVAVNARTGAGYTALIAWALVRALLLHPALNATLEGDVLRQHAAIHLGLAVALEDGLIVPVVRNAGTLSFDDLSQQMRELSEKVRAGAREPGNVSGSTFSLTTLGAYEIDAFTPILNPPEVGILGIGRVREAIVPRDGQPALGHVVTLSLTFDHRAVDGAPAAAFLRTVKQLVESHDTFSGVGG